MLTLRCWGGTAGAPAPGTKDAVGTFGAPGSAERGLGIPMEVGNEKWKVKPTPLGTFTSHPASCLPLHHCGMSPCHGPFWDRPVGQQGQFWDLAALESPGSVWMLMGAGCRGRGRHLIRVTARGSPEVPRCHFPTLMSLCVTRHFLMWLASKIISLLWGQGGICFSSVMIQMSPLSCH